MQQQHRRTNSPITDALYGGRKSGKKTKAPTGPKREINPRRTFGIAGQLDAETLRKLEAMGSGPERKPRRKRGR